MALLRIRVVGDDRRLGQVSESGRQETRQPWAELVGIEQLHHQHGLDQAGREKIVQRRLVSDRRVPVGAVPFLRGFPDLELERRIRRCARVVERQHAGKSGVAVAPGADRIGRAGDEAGDTQVILEP